MKRNWSELPRGDKRAQWAGVYVTMNGKGVIVINRAAHERLGSPDAFLVLYDAPNNTIGLKPTRASSSRDRSSVMHSRGAKPRPHRRATGGSRRSIIATVTFMTTGALAVVATRHLLGG